MKCIVLNFETAEVDVFSYDHTQDIEEILTERFEYSLNSIEYMCVEDLKMNIR